MLGLYTVLVTSTMVIIKTVTIIMLVLSFSSRYRNPKMPEIMKTGVRAGPVLRFSWLRERMSFVAGICQDADSGDQTGNGALEIPKVKRALFKSIPDVLVVLRCTGHDQVIARMHAASSDYAGLEHSMLKLAAVLLPEKEETCLRES